MTRTLLALLIATMAAAFLAAEATGAAQDEDETPRTTSARLELDGRGTALLRGRFVVFGILPRPAFVVIVDRAGDGRATVDGDRVALRRGKARKIRRAKGRIYLEGRNIVVSVRSSSILLSVAGLGWSSLRGTGSFRLNDGESFAWDGKPIRIHPRTPPDLGRADENEPKPAQRAPRRVAAVARSTAT